LRSLPLRGLSDDNSYILGTSYTRVYVLLRLVVRGSVLQDVEEGSGKLADTH
jgi:hypothetical protein